MINFRNTQFVKSAPRLSERPSTFSCEFLFVGKSNVGKSSLLNSLCDNKNLAFTSSKPGHTTLLNYFNVDERFYLVDAPGYGYSARGKDALLHFGEMMESYFQNNPYLKGVLLLIDSRHKPSRDDKDFYEFLRYYNYPFALVMTKCDKLNQKGRAAIRKNLTSVFGKVEVPIILTSALNKDSLDKLKQLITYWVSENEETCTNNSA
ncbi:MAG: YihA family ribosome biogenesis GTP-binding protein [Erysipelotrichaceae bacterium]|nr:YihA family ribosome biogenesis GTP-binding protein [Erysipelotrichaceae bacterium]